MLEELFSTSSLTGILALVTIHVHLAYVRRDVGRHTRVLAVLVDGHSGTNKHRHLAKAIAELKEHPT